MTSISDTRVGVLFFFFFFFLLRSASFLFQHSLPYAPMLRACMNIIDARGGSGTSGVFFFLSFPIRSPICHASACHGLAHHGVFLISSSLYGPASVSISQNPEALVFCFCSAAKILRLYVSMCTLQIPCRKQGSDPRGRNQNGIVRSSTRGKENTKGPLGLHSAERRLPRSVAAGDDTACSHRDHRRRHPSPLWPLQRGFMGHARAWTASPPQAVMSSRQ